MADMGVGTHPTRSPSTYHFDVSFAQLQICYKFLLGTMPRTL